MEYDRFHTESLLLSVQDDKIGPLSMEAGTPVNGANNDVVSDQAQGGCLTVEVIQTPGMEARNPKMIQAIMETPRIMVEETQITAAVVETLSRHPWFNEAVRNFYGKEL